MPELASHDHIRKTAPLIQAALQEANLQPEDIDGVAYTTGPGLAGALLGGRNDRTLIGVCLNVPGIGGASYGRAFACTDVGRASLEFPLALLVSGIPS